jgi:hypothetical protein
VIRISTRVLGNDQIGSQTASGRISEMRDFVLAGEGGVDYSEECIK